MEEVNTPLGLDFDHTQMLVLATSELFRLSHDLSFRHRGLEDALSARNKQESKRKRYDRLKVPSYHPPCTTSQQGSCVHTCLSDVCASTRMNE